MSVEYLEDLEKNAIEAVRTLEGERYWDYSWGLMELVRQAKHYQRIAESVLGAHCGLKLDANHEEFERANVNRDWFRYPKEDKCPSEKKSIPSTSGPSALTERQSE